MYYKNNLLIYIKYIHKNKKLNLILMNTETKIKSLYFLFAFANNM